MDSAFPVAPATASRRLAALGSELARRLRRLAPPAAGLLVFALLWQGASATIDTSLGRFPGPLQVWEQAGNLWAEHRRERRREADFYRRQEARNAARQAVDPDYVPRLRPYTGKPTFVDQIGRSLLTVAFGFAVATLVALPLGVLCGLSETAYRALNPLIQVFKPVSPLAWLPLVTLVVSAVYTSADPLFEKAFLNSAFTVALCCLWPTVINTAVGVAGVDRDLANVGRVLRLSPLTRLRRIVLPAAVPMVFTGLRLSLATGWMVLIAAEMLAQNPGLGKFIWDEFQNGSSDSLARILVAVLAIGLIGLGLDRGMLALQRFASWDKGAAVR
ncbi:MAG: nitrate ABC transporter permease [Porticoccaceae bacterium]|nr:MAG: nitrate ABC transporter permease [Porticoccaceae bacterium]